MILIYTSPFNLQNHLVVQWLYSDGSQQPISLKPSESSGGGGCIAMVLQNTSPCNHQNRLVVVVVSVWAIAFLPPTVQSIWLPAVVISS
jgi:hypothetical protein